MLKKVINILKKCINKISNSELIIIYTGIILFIKMCFFYEETIYYIERMPVDIVARTFIFSMFVVTALFILKNKLRFIMSCVVNLFFSVIMLIDALYYNYSTSLISIAQINNLQYSEQISNAMGELIKFSQIFYILDLLIILICILKKVIIFEKGKKYNWKPAMLYIMIMFVVCNSTITNYISEAEECKYNKKSQLETGTLYTFHYLDVESNFNLKKTAKYSNKSDMMEAYNKLKEDYKNQYKEDIYDIKGCAANKNVISIQLESIQKFVINKTINGKEITPNLNKFLDENIRISNMEIQSYSTTADSEHSAITSLYPLENGMAFSQYCSNKYDDIFALYKKSDYTTMYMHGNEGSFWNRKNVYGVLDVDDLDFMDSFDSDSELINNWISDESLYRQAVKKMKNIEEPFFADIVASSSHTGFDLPGLEDKYTKVSIDVGKYKDTYFGNYLEAVNYADYAFGILIEQLKYEDLYDDSVILVFGDHYGMQMYNEEMIDFLTESDHKYNDVENQINYINVACGIKIPGMEHIEIKKTVSKLDIKPTLAYISGLEDGVSLGSNIFGTKDFACLNNGIIVTDAYYYNGEWYDKLTGEKVKLNELSEMQLDKLNYYKNNMEQEIAISNSIILNNLLK